MNWWVIGAAPAATAAFFWALSVSWWAAGLVAVVLLYALVARVLWCALRQAKRADDATEELISNLSDTGERVDDLVNRALLPHTAVSEADALPSCRAEAIPERAYPVFEDFDFESAWQKHERAFEDDYEAGHV